MQKSKFITIYGINNVGKSTQAKLLVEKLESSGYKAKYVKYPIYDLEPTGPFLNKVLRGSDDLSKKISEDELQLWFILNRYQYEPELIKMLESGYTVVAEDYIGTGIAWGTAKGLDQTWLIDSNKYLLKEDLSILIEGERDARVIEKNHMHEQNPELIEKCTKILDDLAIKYGWQRVRRKEKVEQTADDLWNTVEKFLQNKI